MKPNMTRFQAVISRLLLIDRRILVILVVAVMFLFVGTAATKGTRPHPQAATLTPAALTVTPAGKLTPSPFPPELLENGNQTIGLTIAACILVLIVVVGILNALLRGGPGDRTPF
jgi:hypothetical protein